VSDLTPLDDHVHEYVNSSGYNCGDDQLFSCGGDNQEALHRQRSGAGNAAYDNMARVMSQEQEPEQQQQHQPQMQPQLQRRRSSYHQQQQHQFSDDVSHHGYNEDSFSDSSPVVINSNDDVPSAARH
jgi:hypothetical protein